MSCPDWKALAAWREDPRAEEPAEWQEALAHLDRGCARCRRDACAADPTLVFRRLAVLPSAVTAPTPVQEASEVEAMRRAVAAMRAGSRVEASERRSRSAWAIHGKRWGTAAALLVAALSMPALPPAPSDPSARLHREAPSAVSAASAALFESSETAFAGQAAQVVLGEDLPTLEGVDDRPDARVYHMDGDGMAVTMIFDESLESLDV
jgi:hypothetical protein